MINAGTTTVNILNRITPNDITFGKNYIERTKNISMFFKTHYRKMRQELEGINYFKKMIINSFDYKESDIIQAVKKDLNLHLQHYYELNKDITYNASILHLAADYGQLDILLALQEPKRKITSFISDEEKRSIAKTNYIINKRKIQYLEKKEEIETNKYDITLISDDEYQYDTNQIIKSSNTIILIKNFKLKNDLINKGFKIEKENNQQIILKNTQ